MRLTPGSRLGPYEVLSILGTGGMAEVFFIEVSRDDSLVAARTVDNVLTLYPLDGGTPIPLPDLGTDAAPMGWTPVANSG